MTNQAVIFQKLEFFIRKYYINELIKGSFFFFGLGLIYFIFISFVEYFLWLPSIGRTFLFYIFIFVEILLLIRFIFYPLFKLFKLKKGINYEIASSIIGNHFSEVGDKLTNFLQLTSSIDKSELLLASINQKSIELNPIPFSNAISFSANKNYFYWTLIPVLFLLIFYITGNSTIITNSFDRIFYHNKTYIKPAPFQFKILNPSLNTVQYKNFTLQVETVGKLIPENVTLSYGNESYFMEVISPGHFQYTFVQPNEDIVFNLKANNVTSSDFSLQINKLPVISNINMQLFFPSYLNKKTEFIKGNGNAIIPEGTTISWTVDAIATDNLTWKSKLTQFSFKKRDNNFVFSNIFTQNTEYQIVSSNSTAINPENLSYSLNVVKDQFPVINIQSVSDKNNQNSNYLLGQISDDYGLSKLQIVYYPVDKPSQISKSNLSFRKGTVDQFLFSFPSNLPIVEGVTYQYYFEIFDNDALHHFKKSKSSVFTNHIQSIEEKQNDLLKEQNETISGLNKSLRNQLKQNSELYKLSKLGKEKNDFDFKDEQKISNFIKQKSQEEQNIKQLAEKLKSNLENLDHKKNDEFKDQLEKRLDKIVNESDKNQKILDELNKLNDKLSSEDLFEKMDKLKAQSKNQSKNLAQLLELTKKYYVEQKAKQLADKLSKLSEDQEKLANTSQVNESEKQKDLNNGFDKLDKELQDLKKDNSNLKSPLDLPKNDNKQESIKDDLNKAFDNLSQNESQKAKSKQKSASKKMRELSESLKENLQSSEMEQLEEDVATLRQITDNLLAFSNAEESLMKLFKSIRSVSPSFNKYIKIQQNLKAQFKHIDDSLFALSLRNPKVSETITKEVGNVDYNISSAIENLTNGNLSKGVSHQQYIISNANSLADRLSDLLFSMQMSLSGMSKGKPKPGQGQDKQLSDIIQKQQSLSDKLKEGFKSQQSKQQQGNSKSNDSEGEAESIMQIYKDQQQLRESLENELEKNGLNPSGKSITDQMKQLEKQLLNKGFKNDVIQKSLQIQQELLKLKTAYQEQGEESKRQSNANKVQFNSYSNQMPTRLLEYFNSIEILNRQSLPLRPNFNNKVQYYFNKK